jgi:hypothetical protein
MANPLGPSPQSTYLDMSIFNALFPKEGGKVVPVPLNFANQQSFNIDLSLLQQRGFIKNIQGVYIDNSNSNSPASVTVAGTNQTITCPGNSQGTFPIFLPANMVFTCTSAGGANVNFFFYNIPLPNSVWSATQAPIYSSSGYLEVSDVALDSAVSAGNVNVLENTTANNNVVKPYFAADELFTGSTATSTAQTITTGNPSFFITDIFVAITGDAAISGGAAELTVTLKDGAATIATGIAAVPAASGSGIAPVALIATRNIQYNSKANANHLTITLSSTLTTGKVYWNIAGGLCSNIGP